MKIIADENIDRPVIDRLRCDGHTVISIFENERGMSDDDVLELSDTENAVLLTLDKDFGEIIYRTGKKTYGIMLIRLYGLPNTIKAEIVSNCINKHSNEILDSFTVITENSIRIRKF